MLVSSCTQLLIYLFNFLMYKDLGGTKKFPIGFRFDKNCCAPLINWIVLVWLFLVQNSFLSSEISIGDKYEFEL